MPENIPLISVIVPVCNVREYLPRCVESILAQTHTNLEIILIDDGSTDGSDMLCDEFAQKDARIRIIHQENAGVSAARNAGLDVAQGDWAGFVDADDWIEPEMYETLLRSCEESGKLIAACGVIRHSLSWITKKDGDYPVVLTVLSRMDALEHIVHRRYFKNGLCFLFSRKLTKTGKGCQVRFEEGVHAGEYMLFAVNAVIRSDGLVCAPEYLYHYCLRKGGVLSSLNDKHLTVVSSWKRIEALILPVSDDLARHARFYLMDTAVDLIIRAKRNGRKEYLSMLRKAARLHVFEYLKTKELKFEDKLRNTTALISPKIAEKAWKEFHKPLRMKQLIYNFIVDACRIFIRLLHRATSNIKLKNKVLFSSRPDFSDSAVEVFNLIKNMEEFKDYKFIWFCTKPKKQIDKRESNVIIKKRIDNPVFRLINLYLESTAKYCVYTHELVGNIYNKKQVRVFIVHGCFGIKKLKLEGSYNHTNYCTYIIRTFLNNNDNTRALGLPRNDRLFDDPADTKKKMGLLGFGKVIIWMPTYKRYRFEGKFHLERNYYQTRKDYDITLQEDSSFYDDVNRTLSAHNILLIIKYHPSQDMRFVLTKETSNIKIIPDEALSFAGIPMYSLLGATDALITDFSSVCYDYLLINKPIGYDMTDLELYIRGDSSWMKTPLDYMPGEKIYSVRDFCNFIDSVANGEDEYEGERKKLLDNIHLHQDNQSAKRVVDLMVNHQSCTS